MVRSKQDAIKLRQSATVSRGIWQAGPHNLEKIAAENCGPHLLVAV